MARTGAGGTIGYSSTTSFVQIGVAIRMSFAGERNQPKGLANCEEFNIEEPNVIAGTPTRGALCTMIVKVKCRDAIPMPSRRFLWTLQQERRPPLTGCWLIREVLAVDRAIDLTV